MVGFRGDLRPVRNQEMAWMAGLLLLSKVRSRVDGRRLVRNQEMVLARMHQCVEDLQRAQNQVMAFRPYLKLPDEPRRHRNRRAAIREKYRETLL
jgi:hypothetical protein